MEELHLVANGLGAAPLQQDLLDAAGAGHPKTLRALQLGLGLHRQRPTAVGGGGTDLNGFPILGRPAPFTRSSPASSLGLQPLEDRPASLSADVARQRLRPDQLPPPLPRLPEGPGTISAAGGGGWGGRKGSTNADVAKQRQSTGTHRSGTRPE